MSSASPRLMCIACEQIEVTLLEVVCPNCLSVLDAEGDLGDVGAPRPNTERVQIGPLDVSSCHLDQVAATTTGRLVFSPASLGWPGAFYSSPLKGLSMSISLRTTFAELKAWRFSFKSHLHHGRPLDVRTEDLVRLVDDAEAAHHLHALINTPELIDFAKGMHLESVHQVDKHGTAGTQGKAPVDYYWLVAHLSGRALEHHKEAARLEALVTSLHRADLVVIRTLGDQIAYHRKKAKHHTITAAGALANWHASIVGQPTAMRPGIDAPVTDFPPLDTTSLEVACQ